MNVEQLKNFGATKEQIAAIRHIHPRRKRDEIIERLIAKTKEIKAEADRLERERIKRSDAAKKAAATRAANEAKAQS